MAVLASIAGRDAVDAGADQPQEGGPVRSGLQGPTRASAKARVSPLRRPDGLTGRSPASPERCPGDGSMTSGVSKKGRICDQAGGILSGCRRWTEPDPGSSPGSARTEGEGSRTCSRSRARTSPAWSSLGVTPMSEVTSILSAIEQGDPSAAEQLLPLVYDELRQLAAERMAQERPGQTLQATALVHEAYLRLVDTEKAQHWDSRGHFFAAAAEAMRRILVEQARGKRRLKRGGGASRHELDEFLLIADDRVDVVLAVHDALDDLERHDTQAAALVKLRFFAGFEHQQAAEVLGLGRRAADRLWLLARTWLYRRLSDEKK